MLSLELGAFGVVAETVLSGRTELPFAKFAPLMLGIHLPIAVCEGVLTAGLLRFVARVKPGVLAGTPSAASADSGHRTRLLLVSFGLAALLMAGVCSWFASEKPDGLEWATGRVAGTEELERPASGWVARVQEWTRRLAVFPDYEFRKEPGGTPGESGRDAHAPVKATDVSKMNAGTSAAGVVGALATGLLVVCVCGVLWLLRRRSRCAAAGQGGGAS